MAVHVDGDPAYPGLGEVKLEGEFLFDDGEDAPRFRHDFGADAVAGQDCDFERFHRGAETRWRLPFANGKDALSAGAN